MDPDRPPRPPSRALLAGLLLLAVALAYGHALGGPYLFDDLNVATSATASKRPLVWLIGRTVRALHPQDTRLEHLVNVGVHALAGLLLFGVVRRTLDVVPRGPPARASAWLAFAVALLWLVHPLQTESVTYISQRAESMAALFVLGALYGLIRAATGAHARAWCALALASFALGMVTKETAATAPLILLLHDRAFLAGSFAEVWRRRRGFHVLLWSTWALLFGAFVVPELHGQRFMGFGTASVGPLEYARSQPGVLLHYLKLAFWPHPLCLDSLWPVATTWREIVPPGLVVGALLAASAWGLVRAHWLGFVGAWFFVILAPTSSFVPIVDLAFEHRMYLPLAAVLVVAVLALWSLARRSGLGPRALVVALVVAATLCTTLTVRRNRDYRSAARMWRTVIEQVPTSPRAHVNLGTALQEEGRADETIAALRRAIELCEARAGCAGDWPISRGRALNQLGGLLVGIGRSAEGIAMLEEAARHGAEHGDRMLEGSAHYNLGRVYEAAGLAQEAFERRLLAARLLADAGLAGDLGDQAREARRFEDAVACYRLALELEPCAENHHRLAAVLGWLQRWEDAVVELRAAIALEPDRPDPYTDLGGALMFLGRPEDARVAFARALEIPPETPAEHTNLGTALFEAGRPEQALAEWRAALALDPAFAETLRAAVGTALEKARKSDARTVELLERFRRELAGDAEPAAAGRGG